MVLTTEHISHLQIEKTVQAVIHLMTSRHPMSSGGGKGFAMPVSEDISYPLYGSVHHPSVEEIVGKDYILFKPEPEKGQVDKAGFDLRIGNYIGISDTVIQDLTAEDIKNMRWVKLEDGEPFILEPNPDGNKVYYVPSYESISLSQDLEVFLDSKSTTGRVGCISHTAGVSSQNHIITALQPFQFPLIVRAGKTKLSQVAIRYKNSSYMSHEEVASRTSVDITENGESLMDRLMTPRGLQMQFDTRNRIYRAKRCDIPIDMDAKGTINPEPYFDCLEGNGEVTINPKTLYLLGSLGIIRLGMTCGFLTREENVLTGTGAWGHFAGIFQPGFTGGITMEVFSPSKRIIRTGYKAGTVIFDKLNGYKDEKFDFHTGTYQGQIPPLLPKMFRQI